MTKVVLTRQLDFTISLQFVSNRKYVWMMCLAAQGFIILHWIRKLNRIIWVWSGTGMPTSFWSNCGWRLASQKILALGSLWCARIENYNEGLDSGRCPKMQYLLKILEHACGGANLQYVCPNASSLCTQQALCLIQYTKWQLWYHRVPLDPGLTHIQVNGLVCQKSTGKIALQTERACFSILLLGCQMQQSVPANVHWLLIFQIREGFLISEASRMPQTTSNSNASLALKCRSWGAALLTLFVQCNWQGQLDILTELLMTYWLSAVHTSGSEVSGVRRWAEWTWGRSCSAEVPHCWALSWQIACCPELPSKESKGMLDYAPASVSYICILIACTAARLSKTLSIW